LRVANLGLCLFWQRSMFRISHLRRQSKLTALIGWQSTSRACLDPCSSSPPRLSPSLLLSGSSGSNFAPPDTRRRESRVYSIEHGFHTLRRQSNLGRVSTWRDSTPAPIQSGPKQGKQGQPQDVHRDAVVFRRIRPVRIPYHTTARLPYLL
jgi:hypothetical protein